MLFNSYSFILLFLPLVLLGWYGFNKYAGKIGADLFLVAASLVFYGLFSVTFVELLLLSCLITYICSRGIFKAGNKRIIIVIAGIVINLGFLFYFKYTNFFIENINAATGKSIQALELALPIGISFYVFAQIAFLVDSYREAKNAVNNSMSISMKSVTPVEYLMYITYFPKIIQGPIALPSEMISQFRDESRRKPDTERFSKGIELFVIGLSKKVLLGDNLAKVADYGFLYTYYMDTITGFLVLLSYALQLYFDFSGYCDMAEGVSLMLGIELPQNFNSPYKALSVRNLWQRWHMTLSRFFVNYVYIPLGGSRHGKLRTAFNVIFIFILSGFWHGAGWTYLCWGLVMGILVVWDDLGIFATKGEIKKHYLLREKPLIIIPKLLGQILTFLMFLVSLVFFRSQNMTYAIQMFKQFFFFAWPGFLFKTAAVLDIPENYVLLQAANLYNKGLTIPIYVATLMVLLVISVFIITRKNAREIVEKKEYGRLKTAGLVILFVWSFISLSEVSTFIYFQF